MKNFRLVVAYVGRPWPFSWGPFTLSGVIELACDEAEVEVSRRDGTQAADLLTVGCRAGELGLATTLDLRGERLVRR